MPEEKFRAVMGEDSYLRFQAWLKGMDTYEQERKPGPEYIDLVYPPSRRYHVLYGEQSLPCQFVSTLPQEQPSPSEP